ncbi:Methyltransferase domain-containing protein [Caballeronia arationis]|uniref:Methyltransferase domain-containing protein n=1 Tax=Caballeronia arationis TaxID=1777142 RepID=A0A7Z7IA63_9BURK|nr:class I SAM-dependent methyltransferase [Caballeronia arationis]SOE80821.1 Methyltransferase domain-containing protein [Caballeronia arationis]
MNAQCPSLADHVVSKNWSDRTSRFQYIERCLDHYYKTPLNRELSPHETMFNEWYLEVGHSAVQVIVNAYLSSYVHRVNTVLDLPCGHGRVLRHLITLFPEARIHACDLDRSGVDFCRDVLGAAEAIYSNEELSDLQFSAQYDLIWIGSLFTHTSRPVMKRWLEHLSKYLSSTGIIVATIHGRWCEVVAQLHPYVNEQAWDGIVRDYRESGYGFRDYEQAENHEYIAGSYGVSLSRGSEIVKDIESIPGLRLYSYTERAWADHQDVIVLGRPAYDAAANG